MSATVDFNVSPFVVIWENTRACDLACVHCRAAAQPLRNRFELTTEEGFALIDQIAELQPKVFVLTGGDPLKRRHVRAHSIRAHEGIGAVAHTECNAAAYRGCGLEDEAARPRPDGGQSRRVERRRAR
jgi:organic radical activating enzyme